MTMVNSGPKWLINDQITAIENKMSVQTSQFANVWSQIKQIRVIFTQLKLWVAVARHNFSKLTKVLLVNVALS